MARFSYITIIVLAIATFTTAAMTSPAHAQVTEAVQGARHDTIGGEAFDGSAALDCANLDSGMIAASLAEACVQGQLVTLAGALPQPVLIVRDFGIGPSPEPLENDNRAQPVTRPAVDAAMRAASMPIPEPVANTNLERPLFLVPVGQDIRIRAQPVNGRVIDIVSAGEVIQVIESPETARAKIGIPDQWIAVRTMSGTEGYTAAWLYQVANAVAPEILSATATPTPTTSPRDSSPAALFIRAQTEEVLVRSRPVDGSVIGVVYQGEVVQVIEPVDTARAKIGVPETWVEVRTVEGREGYTAAWLYTIEEVGTTATAASVGPNAASVAVFLVPRSDSGIRVRSTPVDGQVVAVVAPGEQVEIVEALEYALPKVGVSDQWVQVRTADGVEGFTAAWLYDVGATVPVETALAPLDESTGTTDLELVSGETGAQPAAAAQPIPPLDNAIASLDVPEAVASAPEPGSSLDIFPASLAPAVIMPDQALPGLDESLVAGVTVDAPPVDQPALEPFNPIKPVSITVLDDISIQRADVFVNDYLMESFIEPPFEFDLDTMLLEDGEYKLVFSVTSLAGMEWSDEVYFDVDVEDQLPGTLIETALVDTTFAPTPETDSARRTLTIEGIERPLAFEFSTAAGLVPAKLESVEEPDAVRVAQPDSLMDVLTAPIVSVVPAPVREFVMADRPEVATIAILLMVLILIPQGIFTIYWMTYTWNNPAAADLYRSPKEFVTPQFSFTAMLPARHEESVIKDTIRAVDRIDYPDHLKEILILIRDEDDDETIRAANEAIQELGKTNIRLITFTDGPRNKPNGLNKGLAVASNDVVCIFDAEDEPHPDIYNIINTVMIRDEADVVQSGVQLMNFRSSWFSVFNVLEYFFWFKSGLHAFTRQFQVTPLGGNTVFFKRHWLERLGGWDEQCLTEDADVGLRLTQLGAKIQIVYEAEHATREETPDTVESFIKQRTRWVQGFYQIFFKWDWARLPTMKQKIVALYILLNSLLQALMIFFIPVGLFIALTQRVEVPIALISYIPIYILLLQLITSLIGIREFAAAYGERLPMFFTLRMIIYYYPYQLLLSIAAFRAVIRFLMREQAWEKTAHSNLHRQEQLSGVA